MEIIEVMQFCLNTLVSVSLYYGDANHVLRSANCIHWRSYHNFFPIRFPLTDNVPNKDAEKFNV